MSFVPLVRIWLWVSVLASAAGWVLSAIGQLNRGGYVLFCALVAVCWWVGRRKVFGPRQTGRGRRSEDRGRKLPPPPTSDLRPPTSYRAGFSVNWEKVRWRYSRPLPGCFAVLALLVLLGGALYPPTTHTGLSYRTPRVLHWLAQGHWYWIHTANYRMNDRACGLEWLTAPVLLFTKSDRALFLINFLPFLLLPGLIFSLLRRLGVRPAVAWQWMWLLPTGYNFLLQAGSIANDTFPTVYALAAVDFGCRAWVSRRPADLWLSLLAAALLTGAKASNLPLLLPWAIVLVPLWPLLKAKPVAALAVAALAALVSFVPTALLNVFYCDDWSGLTLERAGMEMKNPLVGLWGNGLLLLLNNLVPPFFPEAGWWNQAALSILPQALVGPLVANFEQGFHLLLEMPTEDWAGLGFGLSWLLVAAVVAAFWFGPCRRNRSATCFDCDRQHDGSDATGRVFQSPANEATWETNRRMPAALRRWVLIAPWAALAAYSMKSGMITGARLISPYYPLLLPLVLAGAGQARVIRRRWWRTLVWGVLLLALLVLVLTPARPLWPARAVLSKFLALRPGQPLIARALSVYTVYSGRSDPLAEVRALLPKELTVVGFMADADDMDISLWRPFGQRRVEHILLSDSPEQIRRRHVQYVVIGGADLAQNGVSLEAWLRRTGAELVATITATLKVSQGPQPWHIARLPR